jgi:hypothetical protein
VEHIVQTELNRVHASSVISEHEDSVKSEIMIWGIQNNMDRISSGLQPIKYSTFRDLANEFWNERIESYGKLRAIRS